MEDVLDLDTVRCVERLLDEGAEVFISALDVGNVLHATVTGTDEHARVYAELLEKWSTLPFDAVDSSVLLGIRLLGDTPELHLATMRAAQALRNDVTLVTPYPNQYSELEALKVVPRSQLVPVQ